MYLGWYLTLEYKDNTKPRVKRALDPLIVQKLYTKV